MILIVKNVIFIMCYLINVKAFPWFLVSQPQIIFSPKSQIVDYVFLVQDVKMQHNECGLKFRL